MTVARELANCLDYARMVARVLPVNHEADAAVDAAFARARPTTSRKLTRKARP